ncbi:hypothetical protein PV350_04885 [Streptomyces sp. PA03-6a]|nr:hypothetical protein [Streptomyces sp. PA03-6a]
MTDQTATSCSCAYDPAAEAHHRPWCRTFDQPAEPDGPKCQHCGADTSNGRSWDGGDKHTCPRCSDWRAQVNRVRGRLELEVARLRAGADPTPVPEAVAPTDAQWLHRLLETPADERLEVIRRVLADAYQGGQCFYSNHGALGDELRAAREELWQLRERLAARSHVWVKGRCPACGGSLFLGEGGYVTCSRLDCPDPDAPNEALDPAMRAKADRLEPAIIEQERLAEELRITRGMLDDDGKRTVDSMLSHAKFVTAKAHEVRYVLAEVLATFSKVTSTGTGEALGYQGAPIHPDDFARWLMIADGPRTAPDQQDAGFSDPSECGHEAAWREVRAAEDKLRRVREVVADMHATTGARHWAGWLDSALGDQPTPDHDQPTWKVGDRIRVTYEGTWHRLGDGEYLMVRAGDDPNNVWHNILPRHSIVELIEAAPEPEPRPCQSGRHVMHPAETCEDIDGQQVAEVPLAEKTLTVKVMHYAAPEPPRPPALSADLEQQLRAAFEREKLCNCARPWVPWPGVAGGYQVRHASTCPTALAAETHEDGPRQPTGHDAVAHFYDSLNAVLRQGAADAMEAIDNWGDKPDRVVHVEGILTAEEFEAVRAAGPPPGTVITRDAVREAVAAYWGPANDAPATTGSLFCTATIQANARGDIARCTREAGHYDPTADSRDTPKRDTWHHGTYGAGTPVDWADWARLARPHAEAQR